MSLLFITSASNKNTKAPCETSEEARPDRVSLPPGAFHHTKGIKQAKHTGNLC